MDSALFHTIVVLFFNLSWLYQRKWEGMKEIYGFGDGPYDVTQKMLTKFLWFYAFSGILTLLIFLYKII
jgi:hypothetical protein